MLAREQERRRKGDKLETLLLTIAEALDIRTVFPRMSDVIQDVIPHVTVAPRVADAGSARCQDSRGVQLPGR